MRNFLLGAAFFISSATSAQTLFTYGKDSASVKEFLHAFTKNNTENKSSRALQEYLDLYIASRLKVKEAQRRGYDTLPQIVTDMAGLRSQILPLYEKDTQSLNRLVDEAFVRSQKDIHLAHLFISFTNSHGEVDTVAAKQKANEASDMLKNGTSFTEVVKKYSDDPSAKINGGDLGYITVFTLPYELENLAYTTPVGKISSVHASKAGFHIFKNLGERKSPGRINAAQILLAFPPEATAAQKKTVKQLADSLYNRLQKGDDFAKLAAAFSNDYLSASANGTLPEFGIGQYDAQFENAILALKDGSISKPFETAHGYHIVKRIAVIPVNASKNNKKELQALKERVEENDRSNSTKDVLAQKALQQAPYQKLPFDAAQLWAFSDSVFSSKQPGIKIQLDGSSPLFKLGNATTSVSDWINYAQTFRYKSDGSGFRPYTQVWDEFVASTALDYYRNNLELFNDDFRNQMNEFMEGNLFFEIMQHDVWGPAQNDSIALKAYYNNNKSKYTWAKSADAVIFYASDATVAQLLSNQLKKTPGAWKELVNNMSDKVSADSARFEWQQIPNSTNSTKEGSITTPLLNKADNTASFAYITHIYTKPDQKSFEEARGLVISDYQAELEKKWVADLKKKYPVTINQNAWTALLNTAKK